MAITNSMIIWTAVLAVIIADFIKVGKITFAIVDQDI